MKRGFRPPIVISLALLCATCAWSQSQSQPPSDADQSTDTQAQPGPKPAFTYPDETPSLDFISQAAENSAITLGIGGGVGWFGNINRNNTQNRVLLQVRPSIKIEQYRPKLAWYFSYAGGLQSYTEGGNSGYNNIFGQTANADILWQFAKHWQMHANDEFIYSANPFDSYITHQGSPTVNNPAPETYFPLSRYTRNSGTLEITDQLTLHDTLDFSGTSFLRRTSASDLATVPFFNLISYGGRASYNHQLSPRWTLGAGYNYNSLDFGHGVQRTGVQTLMLSGQYLIQPHMVISIWVGPEYSSTKSVVAIPILGFTFYQVVHSNLWSTAGGATFGWQGIRNSFRANVSRQVSDGGGILATTQMVRVGAEFRRQLRPRWSVELGATYWKDTSITLSSRKFAYTVADVRLTHEITRSLNASLQYAYGHETQSDISLGAPSYNDNRIQFNIQYDWHHPLGR